MTVYQEMGTEESGVNGGGGGVDETTVKVHVEVEDLIHISDFSRARQVKPVTVRETAPSYAWLMPYCKVVSIATLVLAVITLLIGYLSFEGSPTTARAFQYTGFCMVGICVIAFIAVIYINSVSDNSLIRSMRSFRKSRAAHPQINKKLGHDG